MNATPISININYDSLAEALGFPRGFVDPSFGRILDRFLEFSNRFQYRYTVFVIGKDLEDPFNRAAVRELHLAGHEIGNHTYSHPMNLGALPTPQIRAEIVQAHELIRKCTGVEPKGFIAPAWSNSQAVTDILIELEYLYDTSVFPSLFLYPMVAKVCVNHLFKDRQKAWHAISRKDYSYPLTKPREPYFARASRGRAARMNHQILVLPLATRSRFAPPLWHTLGFVLGWDYAKNYLKAVLEETSYFYYLMHPADLAGPDDIDARYVHSLERMKVPLQDKLRAVEGMLDIIAASKRRICTLRELAQEILASAKGRPMFRGIETKCA